MVEVGHGCGQQRVHTPVDTKPTRVPVHRCRGVGGLPRQVDTNLAIAGPQRRATHLHPGGHDRRQHQVEGMPHPVAVRGRRRAHRKLRPHPHHAAVDPVDDDLLPIGRREAHLPRHGRLPLQFTQVRRQPTTHVHVSGDLPRAVADRRVVGAFG
jgi:hypothetical protein